MLLLLLFVSLSFGSGDGHGGLLLSTHDVQKRIDEAYAKEVVRIESEQRLVDDERLRFVNIILPVVEHAIVNSKASVSFGETHLCDGNYNKLIRPGDFCVWWRRNFNKTTCAYGKPTLHCPLIIGFVKE